MSRSEELFAASRELIPGGVNSPVRAFRGLSSAPRFIEHGQGSKLFDVDGNSYIDYVGSYGPLILGHAPPRVVDALKEVIESGTSFGAPTELELAMAEKVCSMVPSVEMVRMVNSGTEAALSAIRLARAATGREGIIKFAGCYHGHADSFLIKAGSGAMTLGVPDSPGVVAALAAQTFVAQYNDLDSVEAILTERSSEIAAVIVEPVAGNMGVVVPEPGFLEGLRRLCTDHGALLVFDEVMTGFRVARGGAQQLYGIEPDVTVLGKVIGGGLPVGAYGGKRTLMELVAPAGPMYQAGTLSGNPLAMRAGLCQLELLDELNAWDQLEEKSAYLEAGIQSVLARLEKKLTFNRVGSMMTLFFSSEPVRDFDSAAQSDRTAFERFFESMLAAGIYLAPSPFEAMFISLAHDTDDLDQTLDAIETSLAKA